ncbi:hypothetical protein [Xenorhabdus szentirmaii]|uniref:hypothetical protein n=1 Tax=Xenorhabdus szentirmaii TaxID=290112 RepID=UPI0019CA0262|nr:hypothetical protein [Xenorhabdus sp. 5]MBD2827087.1 hypothetical protein [Xenorhabdus sp. 5]
MRSFNNIDGDHFCAPMLLGDRHQGDVLSAHRLCSTYPEVNSTDRQDYHANTDDY